jgi:hypothetical protein
MDWVLVFSGQVEGDAAGRQDVKARTAVQENADYRRGVEKVLKVVQYEKEMFVV